MDLKCKFLFGKYHHSAAVPSWTWYDLESHAPWNGQTSRVRYRRFSGIESTGKPKNVYTETYAEAAHERIYNTYPSGVMNEATKVGLDIVFFGEDRTETKDLVVGMFQEDNGLTVYWDNIRRRCAILLFDSETSPQYDQYVSSEPNIEYVFEFTNITGGCPVIDIQYQSLSSIPTTLLEAYAAPIITSSLS